MSWSLFYALYNLNRANQKYVREDIPSSSVASSMS
jgi:hypothetical protein